MVKLRMAQSLTDAIKFVEQGRKSFWLYTDHDSMFSQTDVRVGPDVMCDPAFLVTRYL